MFIHHIEICWLCASSIESKKNKNKKVNLNHFTVIANKQRMPRLSKAIRQIPIIYNIILMQQTKKFDAKR